MSGVIPALSSYGLFTLDTPFQNMLTPDTPYTCVALRKLSDITKAGKDPYAEYYEPYGVSKAAYAIDGAADVCIVSLQDEGGGIKYVPSSYVLAFPDGNGVKYTPLTIAAELGAVPDSLDLSWLRQEMVDLIKRTIGITTVTTHAVAHGTTVLINRTTHEAYEAARQANITTLGSTQQQLIAAQAALAAVLVQKAALEDYIKQNLPTP